MYPFWSPHECIDGKAIRLPEQLLSMVSHDTCERRYTS